jgi:hypothetical protein
LALAGPFPQQCKRRATFTARGQDTFVLKRGKSWTPIGRFNEPMGSNTMGSLKISNRLQRARPANRENDRSPPAAW